VSASDERRTTGALERNVATGRSDSPPPSPASRWLWQPSPSTWARPWPGSEWSS